MSGQEYGITLGFVALFTALFDMVDLKPGTGSYLFVQSLSYLIYLSFRTALGVVAVFALVQSGVELPLFVTGLVGVLSSLTILQSLGLSVARERIATLEPLLNRFREDILSDNAVRIERARMRRWYAGIDSLVQQDEGSLRREFETWVALLSMSGTEIRDTLNNQLQQIPQTDTERRRAAYVTALVNTVNALNRPGLLELIVQKYAPRQRWWPPWARRRQSSG